MPLAFNPLQHGTAFATPEHEANLATEPGHHHGRDLLRIALRTSAVLRALLAAAGIAGASHALADNASGFYGLVAGGIGYWEDGEDSRMVAMRNTGATAGSTDSTSAAYKIGAGYQFNTYNGLELAYHNGAKYAHHLSDGVDTLDIDIKVRRVSLVYVLSIPATTNLSFNLRAGVHRWEEKASVDGEDAGKRKGTSGTWGVGTKYRLGERTALTLDYHTFHQQEDSLYLDFGELMAGVQVRF